jgi:hypothetical protein
VSQLPPTARAIAHVMRWCDLYSHGIPEDAAASRREELLCDLTDQVEWAAAHEVPQGRVAGSIYLRALRGAPADLSWRRQQRSWAELGSPAFRRFGVGLLSATVTSGFGVMVLAIAAIVRTAQAAGMADLMGRRADVLVLVAAIALLLGQVLLIRPRTRSLGALWMLTAAEAVVFVGLPMFANTGRLLYLASLSAGWTTCLGLAGLGVATGALWWLNPKTEAKGEP